MTHATLRKTTNGYEVKVDDEGALDGGITMTTETLNDAMEFCEGHGIQVGGPLAWAWRLGSMVVEYSETAKAEDWDAAQLLEALRDSTDPAYHDAGVAVGELLEAWGTTRG